jgi:hypothetical protein
MKLDRDMMALLKATKKAARPPAESLDRILKSVASRKSASNASETETAHGPDIGC